MENVMSAQKGHQLSTTMTRVTSHLNRALMMCIAHGNGEIYIQINSFARAFAIHNIFCHSAVCGPYNDDVSSDSTLQETPVVYNWPAGLIANANRSKCRDMVRARGASAWRVRSCCERSANIGQWSVVHIAIAAINETINTFVGARNSSTQ